MNKELKLTTYINKNVNINIDEDIFTLKNVDLSVYSRGDRINKIRAVRLKNNDDDFNNFVSPHQENSNIIDIEGFTKFLTYKIIK